MQKLRFICKIYIIFIASKEDRLKIDLINENQRSKNPGNVKDIPYENNGEMGESRSGCKGDKG